MKTLCIHLWGHAAKPPFDKCESWVYASKLKVESEELSIIIPSELDSAKTEMKRLHTTTGAVRFKITLYSPHSVQHWRYFKYEDGVVYETDRRL